MPDRGEGQLAFDFEELVREEARGRLDEWSGAPLRFTTGYYSPAALDAAFEHWCFLNGRFDSFARSHMWSRITWNREELQFQEHRIALFSADLSSRRGTEGPGRGGLSQAICEPCGWHELSVSENAAVEAWHDHAVDGWRELPVVPAQIRVRNEKGLTALARKWIEVHYPPQLQVPGAPIITERQPTGTRHVPGYSPWGGYDLSSTALTATETSEDVMEVDLDLAATRAAVRSPGRSIGD